MKYPKLVTQKDKVDDRWFLRAGSNCVRGGENILEVVCGGKCIKCHPTMCSFKWLIAQYVNFRGIKFECQKEIIIIII